MIGHIEAATGRPVSRETLERLNSYVALLHAEAQNQNLVSASTLDDLWSRHILDSAQLLRFTKLGGNSLDIGSGAGLPGLVLAILGVAPITLVEPRRLRADFLQRVVDQLELAGTEVVHGKVEHLRGPFDVITARAVAPTTRLFALAAPLSHDGTLWVLPKGRTAQSELAEAQITWQGDFRLEPSLTSDEASILVATNVRRRGRA